MSKKTSNDPVEIARIHAAVQAGKILAAQARQRKANNKAWFIESQKGNLQAIKELLAAGVDVDVLDMTVDPAVRLASTGLACATRAGSIECVQEMLAAGPSREHLSMGRTAALRADAADIFTALARHEFPGAIGLPMQRALHINAAQALSIDAPHCFDAIVRMLRGNNPNLAGRLLENSWLHEAALAVAPKCLEKMLMLFDSNLPNKNQQTALMLVAGLPLQRIPGMGRRAQGREDCVRLLLPSANLLAKDSRGRTAFDLALEAGSLEAAALIEAAEIGSMGEAAEQRAAKPGMRL